MIKTKISKINKDVKVFILVLWNDNNKKTIGYVSKVSVKFTRRHILNQVSNFYG